MVHPLSSEGKPIRIVKFQIPAAVTAIPTGWKNRFYGRVGESLVDLSQEKIDRIEVNAELIGLEKLLTGFLYRIWTQRLFRLPEPITENAFPMQLILTQ